ncbi:hypothetical protein [Shimia sp.]|uniref:outer membrane protein n=1 Tax=Shimia sp. TaxID=1954381 RepID=UPI00329A1DEF
MKSNLLTALFLSTAGIVSATGGANAQSLPAPGQSEDNGWRHALAVYMFAPLRTWGDSTVGGTTASIDLSLGDLLDVLDFALAGRYEGWNGDFGIILDANYAGIEQSGNLPGPGGAAFNVNVRQKWFGVLGAYRVNSGTTKSGQPFAIDVQGGLRWNSIKQTLTVGPATAGGDESWIEPVVGLRGMWRLNEKWTTVASADLGGFGAGGNDLQAAVNAGFDYQPWENVALTFGYRYLSVDYSSNLGGGFAYDVDQHGPYVGVKFFF